MKAENILLSYTVLHHDAHCSVGPIHEKLSPKNFGKDDVSFESV